jgi:hypothetical protein
MTTSTPVGPCASFCGALIASHDLDLCWWTMSEIHPAADLSYERIKRRPILGGLINEYERAA